MPSRSAVNWLRLALVIGVVVHGLWHLGYTIDDAAISFVYARNLAAGRGPVFQPGDAVVEGATNLLWVAILAVPARIGLDLVPVSKLLGLVSAAGLVWLTVTFPDLPGRLPGRIGRLPLGEIPRLLAGLLVTIAAPVAIWSVAGLETTFFGVLLLAGAAALVRGACPAARQPGLTVAGFGLLLLAALTRPEGAVFLLAATSLAIVWLARDRGRGWPAVAAGSAVAGLGLAALTVARLAVFGWPLPNTYYAKAGERSLTALAGYWWNPADPGWGYLARFAAEAWLVPAVILVLVAAPAWRQRGAWTVAALLGAGSAAVVLEGGDDMIAYRFLVPLIPFGALAVAASLGALAGDRRPAILRLAVPLVGLWLAANLRWTWAERVDPLATLGEVSAVAHRIETGLAGAGIVAPTVATPDIGGFGWATDLRVIDLGRLVDPTLAHHRYARPIFPAYLYDQRRPTLIRTHHHWTTDSRLADEPAFPADYLPLREWREGGVLGGEFLRRDSLIGPVPPEAAPPVGNRPTAGGLELRGWEDVTLPGDDRTRIWLYWTRTQPIPANPTLTIRAAAPVGRSIEFDHQPTGGLLGADRWPDGTIVRDYLEIPLDRLGSGDLSVAISAAGSTEPPAVIGPIQRGATDPPARRAWTRAIAAGDPSAAIPLLRRLGAGRTPADPALLELLAVTRDAAGRSILTSDEARMAARLAADLWPFAGRGTPPEALRSAAERCAVRAGAAVAADRAEEAIDWLVCATDLSPERADWRRDLEDLRARVDGAALAAVPPTATPVDATFGRRIRLLGHEVAGAPVAGRPVTVTLYFEPIAPVSADDEIVVHLEAAGARVVADHYPAVPISRWQPGRVWRDRVTFNLPPDAAGPAALWVGIWDRREDRPVTAGMADNDGRRVRIAVLDIVPPG